MNTPRETRTYSTHCEVHDEAGMCTEECAQLLRDMGVGSNYSGGDMVYGDYLGGSSSIDVSGCHSPKPMPYDVVVYDDINKAVLITTEHPEDCMCPDDNCPSYLHP